MKFRILLAPLFLLTLVGCSSSRDGDSAGFWSIGIPSGCVIGWAINQIRKQAKK